MLLAVMPRCCMTEQADVMMEVSAASTTSCAALNQSRRYQILMTATEPNQHLSAQLLVMQVGQRNTDCRADACVDEHRLHITSAHGIDSAAVQPLQFAVMLSSSGLLPLLVWLLKQ